MQQLHGQNRKGQVLVMVALTLLVLLGIVALAVDGGHLYAERRKMQNAADAGALAGARVLCFEEKATFGYYEGDVEKEARLYAEDLNGAEVAVVTVTGNLTVTVVATETATTFFARVIGFPTADVAARASAMCQGAEAVGNIWPLAIRESVYTGTLAIGCGNLFYAYIDTEEVNKTNGCSFLLDDTDLGDAFPPVCYDKEGVEIDYLDFELEATEIDHIGPGDRGWLDLFEAEPPYDEICTTGCGSANVKCWLLPGHPGPIELNQCLEDERGVDANTLMAVNDVACNYYNLPLFNTKCSEDERLWGCKEPVDALVGPHIAYRVSGFGCIRVIGYYTANFECTALPANNVKVVIVQKMCEYDADGDEMPGYAGNCRTIEGDPTGETAATSAPRIVLLSE